MGNRIRIRPLQANEISRIEQSIARPSNLHRDRFALQQANEAEYLVAWNEHRPVGQVLIKWDGTNREPMASLLKHCPQLSDLFVVEDCRSKGIGTQLLSVAEQSIIVRGYHQAALGIAIDNTRAHSLYRRLGYHDLGFDPYTIEYLVVDPNGRAITVTEQAVYLVKVLQDSENSD